MDLNGVSLGVGNLNGTGGKVLNSDNGTGVALTIGNGNGTGGTYAGSIADNVGGGATGTVALVKTGTGTITLSGANTYSGGTTLAGGALSVSAANNLGSGSVTFDGGALDATTSFNPTQTFTVDAVSGNTLNIGAGQRLDLQSASNQLVGAGNLTVTGGELALGLDTQTNSYTGTITISGAGAVVELDGTGATSGAFVATNGGNLAVPGSQYASSFKVGATTVSNAVTLGNGGVLSFDNGSGGIVSGSISLSSGVNGGGIIQLANFYQTSPASSSGTVFGPHLRHGRPFHQLGQRLHARNALPRRFQ